MHCEIFFTCELILFAPLSFDCCFQSPEREFLIRVSYLEIYQENVVDLLGNLAKHLDIKENYVR